MLTFSLISLVLTTLTAAAPAPEVIVSPEHENLLINCYTPGTVVLQKAHCQGALDKFTTDHFGPLRTDATFTKDPEQARKPGYILADDPIKNEECFLDFGVVSLTSQTCSVELTWLIDQAKAIINYCIIDGEANGGVSYVASNVPAIRCHVSVNVSQYAKLADEQQVNGLIDQAAANRGDLVQKPDVI